MQRGKEGIARVPSLPVHPSLGLGMILRLASGVVNHTTHEKKKHELDLLLLFCFLRRAGYPTRNVCRNIEGNIWGHRFNLSYVLCFIFSTINLDK